MRIVVRQQRLVIRYGVTIHHRGGAVPRAVVDNIIGQLEDGFKREGWKDSTNWTLAKDEEERAKAEGRGPYYWRVSEPVDPDQRNVGYFEKLSKELADRAYFEQEYRRKIAYGTAEEKKRNMSYLEYSQKKGARAQTVGVPDDFKPSNIVGICANPDPHSETFCVRFVQDDGKDSWRDLGDFTKTQFIRTGPGVHVGLCDFLEDVQKKVKAAGGDYEISDEGEYCDDVEGHKHDVREVVKAVNETAKVINSVTGMLAEQGWKVEPNEARKFPQGEYNPGTLDQWLGADLLIAVPSRVRTVSAEELATLAGIRT